MDKSTPFSVRLGTNGETIGEYREPSGFLRRFVILKPDDKDFFGIEKPSSFGGINRIRGTRSQVREILCQDLQEHEADQMLDFAAKNPFITCQR